MVKNIVYIFLLVMITLTGCRPALYVWEEDVTGGTDLDLRYFKTPKECKAERYMRRFRNNIATYEYQEPVETDSMYYVPLTKKSFMRKTKLGFYILKRKDKDQIVDEVGE